MKADLHIHSDISDGSDSIEELIDTAINKGLDAIALTEHDTLSHLSKIPANDDIIVIGELKYPPFTVKQIRGRIFWDIT